MNNMKKTFALSILMIIAIGVSYASDFNTVSSSGHTLYYNIIDATAHTVAVTYPGATSGSWGGYTKPSGSVTIPSTVTNGGVAYSVVAIDDLAFYDCSGITYVSIPNTIKTIGIGSFSGCSLSYVQVPNSVERIGSGAFGSVNGSYSMTWANSLPDGVVYLGKIAYEYKGTMPPNTVITFNSDTKGIAGEAFSGQTNLRTINLPASLLTIESESFKNCGGLQTITIPASVKYIGHSAFKNCGALLTVTYNAVNVADINVLGYAPAYAVFAGCDNFTTLNIGNSVQVIPANIFNNCTHISGPVNLPSSIRKIGENAFYGCTGITSVTIPANVDTIEHGSFNGCTSIYTVHYNATNCRSNYATPFYGCTSLSSIVFGTGVQTIPDYLCYNLTSLVGTLNLPNNIQKIGSYAFSGCSGYNGSLIIPDNVRRICAYAFSNCTGITALTLGINLDTLETGAFSGTSAITSITYKATNCTNGLTNWMFSGNAITSLYINSNVQSIPDYLIGTCPNLTTVTFPSNISRIGMNNFHNCGLTGTLTLPSSITEIGYGAFALCSGVSEIQCNASMPPTVPPMYGISFIFANCWNVPLYVPCSSVTAYQNAPGWSNFTNISGMGGCNYTVTLSVNNSSMGSVSGGGTYTQGTTVTISATANNGYHFDHWSDGNTQNPRSLTVTGDISLTAYFVSTQGIEDVDENTVVVYVDNGKVKVIGSKEEPVRVFNMIGQQMNNNALPTGVYMVKIGSLPARRVVVIR